MRSFMNILEEALKEDSLIDKDSAPPEYEDKDAEHYAARRETGFFGAQASGCILMAKTTGRVMIVFRSDAVDQPRTWGNIGGAHGKEERPVDAARREAHEETGYTGDVKMIPLMVFTKGTFRYSNFLGIVADEFETHLGWEATKAVWVDIGKWPSPLHFGLQALFADVASMKTIRHYSEMFVSGKHAIESVEEDLNIPAGVDVKKAIDAAQDTVDGLVADTTAANPSGTKPNATGTVPNAAPAKPGAPNAAPATGTNVAAKKSLAPIRPQ